MTREINQEKGAMPIQEMKDFTAQWVKFFDDMQLVLKENEQLRQRVKALESKNKALTDIINQRKSNV